MKPTHLDAGECEYSSSLLPDCASHNDLQQYLYHKHHSHNDLRPVTTALADRRNAEKAMGYARPEVGKDSMLGQIRDHDQTDSNTTYMDSMLLLALAGNTRPLVEVEDR